MTGPEKMLRGFMLALAITAWTTPAESQSSLQQRVIRELAAAEPGTRFGLVVLDERGREIVAINPDDRFIPASNTKLFTTAAAFADLAGVDQPDHDSGAVVRLEEVRRGVRDVVLEGHGDARL